MTIGDILGRKYAIEMLMEVYRNPGRSGWQLCGSSRTRLLVLKHLRDCGLVEIDDDPRQYNTHIYYPTGKGEVIAKLLDLAETVEVAL